MKKSNVDKAMCNCTLVFLSKNDVQFFLQFSLYFREKIFWWDRKENTQVNIQEERKTKKNEAQQRRQAHVQLHMGLSTHVGLSMLLCLHMGIFVQKKMSNFSLQFSLHFRKKSFQWAQEENTWVPPFIFLSPHSTKHTPKKFSFYFLFIVFHSPYFTSKQTHPKRNKESSLQKVLNPKLEEIY